MLFHKHDINNLYFSNHSVFVLPWLLKVLINHRTYKLTLCNFLKPFLNDFNIHNNPFSTNNLRFHCSQSPVCIGFSIILFHAAKSLQSCPTLCDPIDGSPPGSPVPGILQARALEWVAISFSNVWKWKVKVKSLSRIQLLDTPWTAAYQVPPSMGFSSQEYWSGLPLPSPIVS